MGLRRRQYEDYEELGRRLAALEEALIALQGEVFRLWGLNSGATEHTRHLTPDVQVLIMVNAAHRLHQQLALECAAEIDEADVPEGKPRIPPPFDHRHPFGV